MNIDKSLSTSGDRLRRARVLAGLNTRREFEKKYSISANTLQGWEQGKNPLSEKGARRVIEAFKWEGLICSVEWLIHGTGMPPRPYEAVNPGSRKHAEPQDAALENNIREEELIYREVQLFKEQNPNAIILTVADDATKPYFNIGDYIGGRQVHGHHINQYVGNVCIVELENNLIVPRLLHKGSRDGLYNVCCTNPTTTASPNNFYDVRVVNAAPIIWHRRKLVALAEKMEAVC